MGHQRQSRIYRNVCTGHCGERLADVQPLRDIYDGVGKIGGRGLESIHCQHESATKAQAGIAAQAKASATDLCYICRHAIV